jgi:hypothetical protein
MVIWFFEHGIVPLYTPLGGSWLNVAESMQCILVRRALSSQDPPTPQQIIEWSEQAVAGWNQNPPPFVRNGKHRKRALLKRCGIWRSSSRLCKVIAAGPTE